MRNLSCQYVIDKILRHASRMSETNKKHGWGTHVMNLTPEEIGKRFDEEFKQATKVI